MKGKIRILISLIYLAIFCPINVFASKISDKISEKDVIDSALKHYPTILSFYERVDSARGDLLSAQGLFDIKLKQDFYERTRGFYDSRSLDTSLERQNRFLGSKVYGGYRKSSGIFPDYEGGSVTNGSGEFRGGVQFSLLQGRGIDENRLGEMLASLSLEESELQLEKIKVEVQRDALKAYWNWVTSGKIYEIYKELYNLAIRRDKQLRTRLSRGDVAQIIVVENKRNILRRKNTMMQAKQDFDNSAIYLSLFLRDSLGQPLIAQNYQVPKFKFTLKDVKKDKLEKDIELALMRRADVKIIKIKKRQELGRLKYSENLLQPKLDVDIGASKDRGNGAIAKRQSENFVNLNFELPLQRREAKGKVAASNAKISAIEYEEQLLQDKVKTDIIQLKNILSNNLAIFKNLQQEVSLAKKLERAERDKFRHGASNFFLVNIREQDTASSKAAQMTMFKKYKAAKADYKAAIFNFDIL